MIDLEKLERIEDQHAALSAATQAVYENYKKRSTAARVHRRDALRRAPGEIQHLTLDQLANYTDEQLHNVKVDLAELQAARSEDRMARRLFAEHAIKQQETTSSLALLNRLRAHAGVDSPGYGAKEFLKA
jgi:hypothetical protein